MPFSSFRFQRAATSVAGPDLRGERPGLAAQGEIFARPHIWPRAHDQRQMGEAPVIHLVDHGPVGGDDEEFALDLPEREGLALDESDRDLAG